MQEPGSAVGKADRVIVLKHMRDLVIVVFAECDGHGRIAVGGRTLSESVPRSGLASTAMTRSPRSDASKAPRPTVVVVFPTPPFRLITATRWWPPATGVRARAISSRRRIWA